MANNEDYLDSLLRAAASQDNPDSAINKVRKIENERAEEEARLQAEEEARIQAEEEATLLAQAEAETITEEPVSIEEPVITEEPLVAEDSIPLEEAVTIEELTVLEEPVAAEEPAPVEEPIIIEEPAAVEEPVTIEEPEVSEEPLAVEEPIAVEEPLTIEEPATIEEPVAIEESPDSSNENMSADDIAALLNSLDSPEPAPEEAVTEQTIEEAPTEEVPTEDSLTSDLDALLNSDFSGEVEMPDVSSLLENAEAFALEENGVEEPQEEPAGDIMDLSSDDMEKLINAASDVSAEGEGNGEMEVDLSDIASLEGELGIFDKNDISGAAGADEGAVADEGELAEISSLLQAIDSNEVESTEEASVLDMLNEAVSKQEEADAENEAWAENKKFDAQKKEEATEVPKKEKKSLLSIFKKKKAEGEEAPKEKKETPFTKFIDFLTASDDDDEEGENTNLINATDAPSEGGEGFEDVPGENKEILNEMDKEGEEGKGKKKKKKKKKKGEPSEGEASDEDGDGEGEEGEATGDKKKKVKKEKGEKKPLVLDIDTAKPLSKRNVKLIAFLAATLLLLIILFTKLVPGVITNSSARKAYYRGDYETTYKSFYGDKKLSDSDQILFNRSEVILKMQHKYDAYKAYSDMGKYMEALDQLLQAVSNYEKWLFAAESCGATEEFNKAYATVLGALSQTYAISEADAKEIIALPTDLEYSLKVYSIVYHTDYIDPNVPLPGEFVPPVEEIIEEPVYEDMLPEEGN